MSKGNVSVAKSGMGGDGSSWRKYESYVTTNSETKHRKGLNLRSSGGFKRSFIRRVFS